MNSINSIAGSAVQAFAASQQVTANNVANVNTDDFRASRAEFRENGPGGVGVAVTATRDRVEISREAVNLMSNGQGFKANLAVLKTADDMTKELFSIKA